MENYCFVSIVIMVNKIFEKFFINQIIVEFNECLSDSLIVYRKRYSCEMVLLVLMEDWKNVLDN